MKLVQRKSPHHNARPLHTIIDCIVLHCDASDNEHGTVAWLEDPVSKVSYHTLIGRRGAVYTFVPLHRRAWHAGKSVFHGRENCNDYSIGLSFANRNDGQEPFTDVQLAAGAAVCAAYMRLHRAITLDRITTHAIVSPGRKTDPGPLFDLEAFRALVQAELEAPEWRPAA